MARGQWQSSAFFIVELEIKVINTSSNNIALLKIIEYITTYQIISASVCDRRQAINLVS